MPLAALLLALAAAAAAALWYARRKGIPITVPGRGKRLRVVERLALGRRSALLVVEYEGRPLLIGQSGDTVSFLAAEALSTTAAAGERSDAA